MHLYEKVLLVPCEETERNFYFIDSYPWCEFLMNPRMLRGSDFLMRWSQGVWSEKRLIDAVNTSGEFFALPYGPSGTAPEDPRGVELYFEKLEAVGLQDQKRPDLLIFKASEKNRILKLVEALGGEAEIAFTPDSDERISEILDKAFIAIECENSLWRAGQMPGFNQPLKPMRRLGGKPGLSKSVVVPTVIIKDEDIARLAAWENAHSVPIHVWHAFFDKAYGISFRRAQELIAEGLILPHAQVFQAPGGATTKKSIYKIYYHYAYPLGTSLAEPELDARVIVDKNGHILPYVSFKGGKLALSTEALSVLEEASNV